MCTYTNNIYIYICMNIYIHVHIHVYLYMCMFIYMYVYISVYIYIKIPVYTYVHMYICHSAAATGGGLFGGAPAASPFGGASSGRLREDEPIDSYVVPFWVVHYSPQ